MDNQKDMLIVVPIMGSLAATKPAWGSLLNSVTDCDLMVIDNAPEADNGEQKDFFEKYIFRTWPGGTKYIPMEDNIGVPKSIQYAYENSNHKILAFMHNDVFIYKRGWDQDVVNLFNDKEKVGAVGFFGAEGINPMSGRFNCWSNMLEAEIHGWRATDGYAEVAVLDGMSMFLSREMLDDGKPKGIDVSFIVHHFYDLDISLQSIDRGYQNYVIFTPIHHQSGMTACHPLFQDWAKEQIDDGERSMYQLNLAKWKTKWSHKLSWKVGDTW